MPSRRGHGLQHTPGCLLPCSMLPQTQQSKTATVCLLLSKDRGPWSSWVVVAQGVSRLPSQRLDWGCRVHAHEGSLAGWLSWCWLSAGWAVLHPLASPAGEPGLSYW